ncbi:MAG: hypothetical protein JHC95_18510, partial [Solirubrobacteraceae bacterium]|nr:hypothetical protein [Solirubrobacteraceae bacterium]
VWDSRVASLILGAELAAGLLLPFVLVRRVPMQVVATGLAIVFAVVCGLAESEVRDTLRVVGWRGA